MPEPPAAGAEPGAGGSQPSLRTILFVCTGNTCRSPLSEVLCRKLLADKLGCSIEELAGHGFTVVSAGIAAWPGDDVSPPAAIVAAEYGADLTKHRSRPVNPELLETATDVVAMTRMHALALSMRFPGLGPEPIMLCGPDGDLDDPIGGDIELYRACARVIVSHLERLIAGWIRK